MSTLRPAVFFDRDGTLIEESGYIDRLDRVRILVHAADALVVLKQAGFALVMITNQSGIAQGMTDVATVEQVHAHIAAHFAAAGAPLDGIYYCPHHPRGAVERWRGECACRKPLPGMAHDAARDLGLDLARSYVIGDRLRDVAVGHAVGGVGILVRSGYGAHDEAHPDPAVVPDAVVDHVHQAALWILLRERALTLKTSPGEVLTPAPPKTSPGEVFTGRGQA